MLLMLGIKSSSRPCWKARPPSSTLPTQPPVGHPLSVQGEESHQTLATQPKEAEGVTLCMAKEVGPMAMVVWMCPLV